MNKIHFIGLGNMGLPMALNLAKSFNVAVFDLNQESCLKAKQEGLAVLSVDTVAVESDVVITMLPAGKHVQQVIVGNDIAKKMQPHSLIIDCSTTDQQTALLLKEYSQKRSIYTIDAPVSGGTKGAKLGTLTFMVGGSSEAFQLAKPLLSAMGKNIFHAGDNGNGQVAKMCNNMLLAISMAGTCEALSLGHALGVNPEVLSNIMHKASGSNWVLDRYNPWPKIMPETPSSDNYQGGFKSELMLKDLKLVEDAALDKNQSIYLGALARNLYSSHCQKGFGDKDFSSILNHYFSLKH